MNRWMQRASNVSNVSSLPNLSSLPSLPSLPSRSDVLDALGLEVRRSRGRALAGGASVFLLGVLAGGLLTLVLAPRSREELRARMQERRGNAGDDLGAQARS